MSRIVDYYLLEKMSYEDDNELIISVTDGEDELLDSMMETKSRIETADIIFPVAERYQVEPDFDLQWIDEGLGVTVCKCGAVINAGETQCESCKKKSREQKRKEEGVLK